jgi:hypothetical protein
MTHLLIYNVNVTGGSLTHTPTPHTHHLPLLQNIAQDCQLGELLPKAWVGPVDGVLPGSGGYRVLWDGLWAELQVGVSAENLVHRGTPGVQPADLLHYLQTKLNSTQVR